MVMSAQGGEMGTQKTFYFTVVLAIFLAFFFTGITAGTEFSQEQNSNNETLIQVAGTNHGQFDEHALPESQYQTIESKTDINSDSPPPETPSSGSGNAGESPPSASPDPLTAETIPEISPTPTTPAGTGFTPVQSPLPSSGICASATPDVETPCPACGGKTEEKSIEPAVDSPEFRQKKQKEIEDVQSTIKAKNKKWKAAKTSVSDLPDEEFNKLLGVKPKSPVVSPEGEEGSIDASAPSFGTLQGLPPSLDWRNNGGDFTTPIRNQRNCGSCWAFATLGTFESRMEIANNNPSLNPDYAEQDLVSCAGCGGCSGAEMDCPLNWILYHGAMNESCYPYVAKDTSCNPGCGRIYRITEWHRISPLYNEAAIKDALTRGPVIGTFAVYQDFSYYSGGIYEYTWGSLRGYHAIVVVGWGQDERGTYWICKNSWGTGWGEAGWFKIRSGNCGINNELYELTVPPVVPPVPTANFIATPARGIRPLAVQFTDLSSNSPVSWQWNFGDGSANAITQNTTHTYSVAGNYTVTLTVTNAYGSSTLQKTGYITVTEPPPFLSGWSCRKLHTITGSPSGDLTDYQVRFKVWNTTGTDSGENVYLGSNVTPDFRDIRFTTTDNTILSYWIQETGPTYAIVWVKVPSIPTTGTQLYLYYGNPSAPSASDGNTTFLFFDDFKEVTIDTTKWSLAGTGSRTVSDGVVRQKISGSYVAESMTAITDNTNSNVVFGVRHRVVQATSPYCGGRYGVKSDYKVAFHNNGGTNKQFLNEGTAWGNIIGQFNLGQWYLTELVYDGSQLKVRDDSSPSWNTWPLSGKSGHLNIWAYATNGGTAETEVDFVYQRLFTENEPQHVLWSNEEIMRSAPVCNFSANLTSGRSPLTIQLIR